uniref:NtCtMGAM_N domain-containing protein n=1 Tax=Anisakis simplex TaxID=6269 RepID=A0A0M3JF39_ANISI
LNPTVPLCYLPKGTGYILRKNSPEKLILKKSPFGARNPFGKDISPIFFSTRSIGSTLNVRIDAPDRYEPTIDLPKKPSRSVDSLYVQILDDLDIFSFKVRRKSTKQFIWDTSIGYYCLYALPQL